MDTPLQPGGTTAPTHPKTTDPSRWGVAALAGPMLVASLGTSVANMALPALALEFAVSMPQAQWVVLAYLLSMTVFIVSAGSLGDLLGRRRVLLAGLGLLAVGAALCALAPSLPWLVAARAVQGLGGAIAMGLSVAMVHDVVPRERAGRAMGVLGSMSAIGTALGPALAGLLIGRFGWQAAFLLLLPPAGFAIVLVLRAVPATQRMAGAGWAAFDTQGSLWLGMTLFALTTVLTLGAHGLSTAIGLALALTGALLFVRHEARTRTPLLDWAAIGQRSLGGSLAANGLVAAVMMTTLIVGPFHLTQALGLTNERAGLALAIGPLLAMASGVPAGRAVDRFGHARVASLGLALMAMATLVLGLLPTRAGLPGYLTGIALLTPGYQLFLAANNTVVMAGVSAAQRGAVSGVLGLSRNLGLIAGASAMGAWFAGVAGRAGGIEHAGAVLQATRSTFLLATALVLLAAWWALRARGSIHVPAQPAAGAAHRGQ